MASPLFARIVASTVLLAAALAAHWGGLDNRLVWDDRYYLLDNPYITEISWDNFRWMFTTFYMSNWHPLTWLSYAIDHAVYGDWWVPGLHLTNLLLHAANVLLFFAVARQLFLRAAADRESAPPLPTITAAAVAALLFAVHPIHVESVAWVSERKDVLFMFFLLLATLAYLRHTERGPRARRWYFAALAGFAAAIMSKPMAVTFPVLLLLIDAYPLRRLVLRDRQSTVNCLLEKVPFLLISVACAVLTFVAQTKAISQGVGLDTRLLVAAQSVFLYLKNLFMPLWLSPLYPHPRDLPLSIGTILPAIVLAAITVAGIALWRRDRPGWLAGWLFYLVALTPVLGIIQVGQQAMADRYAYLPVLPLYLLAGHLAARAIHPEPAGSNAGWFALRASTLAVLASVAMLLVYQTQTQTGFWRNPASPWERVIQLEPHNAYARVNLGGGYFGLGRYEEAVAAYKAAAGDGVLNGNHIQAFALSLIATGRYESAAMLYRATLDTEQDIGIHPDCLSINLAWNLMRLGDVSGAKEALARIGAESAFSAHAATLRRAVDVVDHPGDATGYCQDIPGDSARIPAAPLATWKLRFE